MKADAFGRGTCLVDPGASPCGSRDHWPWLDQFQPHHQPAAQAGGAVVDQLRGCSRGVELRHPCRTAGRRSAGGKPVRLGQRRQLRVADGFRGGSPGRRDALPGDHHRSAGDGVLPRLHGPRQGLRPLFHLPGAIQQLDAGTDHQPESPRDLRVLGAGGDVFLPLGGFLVRPGWCSPRRPESLCGQPRRRLRFAAGHPRTVLGHRQLRFPGHCRWFA